MLWVLFSFPPEKSKMVTLGKCLAEVPGAPPPFPAGIKRDDQLGDASNFPRWAIPRRTNHSEGEAGKREGVRGFGQHSFFPVLSEVDFDESREEFPSPQSLPSKDNCNECWQSCPHL